MEFALKPEGNYCNPLQTRRANLVTLLHLGVKRPRLRRRFSYAWVSHGLSNSHQLKISRLSARRREVVLYASIQNKIGQILMNRPMRKMLGHVKTRIARQLMMDTGARLHRRPFQRRTRRGQSQPTWFVHHDGTSSASNLSSHEEWNTTKVGFRRNWGSTEFTGHRYIIDSLSFCPKLEGAVVCRLMLSSRGLEIVRRSSRWGLGCATEFQEWPPFLLLADLSESLKPRVTV